MPNNLPASAHEALYKQTKYRVANPLEHQIECLDVLSRVKRRLLQRVTSKMAGSLRPLLNQGSMLSKERMADESGWQSADGTLARLQGGLLDLKSYLITRPSDETIFKKKNLPRLDLAWRTSNGQSSAWFARIAGDLVEDTVSCTLDGLTAASVDYPQVRQWIISGKWRPSAPILQMCCAERSFTDTNVISKVKSLWIVTDVLYATRFTLKGARSGQFDSIDAQVAAGVPADVTVNVKNNVMEVKAKRNKQFVVGYRTMRVDYNLDGVLQALRAAEDTGLRGDDDDPYQTNLRLMEEDIFDVVEGGDKVPIPLLMLSKQDLDALQLIHQTR